MNNYAYMDEWSDEKVAKFKEEGAELQEVFGYKSLKASHSFFERPQIVAEGDSWFDYLPGTDLIDCLRMHHGYSIKNYADAGDTLENMVYGTKFKSGSYLPSKPTIFSVLRKIEHIKPKVFLFSGGGNDIAGDEFGSFLNHAETGLPPLRNEYVDYMINNVFKKCCEDLISKVATVSPQTHIIMHGYGYTAPTGKAVSLLGFKFAGPWLRSALTEKRILDADIQARTVKVMIDSYNEMLKSLDKKYSFFHHVDLRPIIDANDDWVNELHLKNSAYARAADRIRDVILEVGLDSMVSNRKEIKQGYDKLFADICAVLFQADPVGINCYTNTDEYEPEARTIIPRLKTANSAQDTHAIVYEEFITWFGADSVGNFEKYQTVSEEIWELWREFQHHQA